MSAPKCRLCGHAHWTNEDHVFPETASRVTAPKKLAGAVKPVKPPAAEPGRSNAEKAKSWRERDPEAYREYMRGYMAKRRAARRVSP